MKKGVKIANDSRKNFLSNLKFFLNFNLFFKKIDNNEIKGIITKMFEKLKLNQTPKKIKIKDKKPVPKPHIKGKFSKLKICLGLNIT